MEYEVIRSRRKTLAAEIRGGRLLIRAPLHTRNTEIEAFIAGHRRWIETHLAEARKRQEVIDEAGLLSSEELDRLCDKARRVIPERVAYYALLVGVDYGRVTVRRQRSRWGSCSSRGNLSFNCLLMLAPPEVLDSVVVHELCHRLEMNHSPRFWSEVLRVMPDYRERHRWLKEHGAVLMGRLG